MKTALLIFAILSSLPLGAAAPPNPKEEAAFIRQVRQLTFEGRRSGEGYFSPDGSRLIFQSEREANNPFYQIFVLDFESGEVRRVSPGIGKTTCGFFCPEQSEILFASTHLDPAALQKQQDELAFRASGKQRRYSWDFDEQMDIFSAGVDGTHLKRLTTALGYDAEASYSPDGGRIVFTSTRDAYPVSNLSPENQARLKTDPSYFAEIYIMNADGTAQRRLTFSPGYDGGPFFSPDGRRIVWRHFNDTGTAAEIFTMKTDGTDPRQVTAFGCMSWAPFYHPSGQYLIFTANKFGFSNFELFIVDTAGEHQPVRVTFTDGFDGLPTFSPDGKKLCWTSTRGSDGLSQLFLADWNDAGARAALAQSPARTNTPATGFSLQADAMPARAPSARSAVISSNDLRATVIYLASDPLKGRFTGSSGSEKAADYIASQLAGLGLEPFGANRSFFQKFEFASGVKTITNACAFTVLNDSSEREFQVERDFQPLSFSGNGQCEGEVVFAGYGLLVPGQGPEKYDSYSGIDVTNKIVLALRYVPEGVDSKRRQELNRYAGLRYKAMVAREHGAKAILIVAGPHSPNAGALVPFTFDSSLSGSRILAASISAEAAAALLQKSGKTLAQLQADLDQENPHAHIGLALPEVRARLSLQLEHLRRSDRNVLAYLPAGFGKTNGPWLAVGAHYDHLGSGQIGSLERKEEAGQIHPGADDNASGVAAVLELAKALAAAHAESPGRFSKGVLFAFWSGEELGLIGSSYFVEHAADPMRGLEDYINFDMVGRLRDNKLMLQGTGSSSRWTRWIEKENIPAGFELVLQKDPYLPTDVTSFYPRGIPVLNFFTGSHEDYHRPTDVADKINYPGLERITRFAFRLLQDLVSSSEALDYVKVERSDSGGTRENLRVYLGTIPDYGAEVNGVKLSGVRGGGPADKAGLKGGDILVQFGAQKIANIYDYTYALDAAKIGQPIEVTVLREGKLVKLTVVPEARK